MADEKKITGKPGPGGPRNMRGPRPKIENPGKVFKRIMGYTLKDYGWCWVVVMICILANVYATLQGTMFTKTLIDDYIMPLIGGI